MSEKARTNGAEKDLEKFVKFLALKSAQAIVQSRLGEKIQTNCYPLATGNDWFNIFIQDHPDVYFETKKALNFVQGQTIFNRLPLCVEISLKTIDGDQMILEVWSLDLQQLNRQQNAGQADAANGIQKPNLVTPEHTLKTAHSIYNRMSLLLKSLLSLTRATPAYKLSRRQSPDTYGIYYRIYVDKPQVHSLGDGYKNVRFGQLHTIMGTIVMAVSYRTKMTISPSASDTTIMLKSDHFLREVSPKHNRYHHIKKQTEKKIIDINKPLRQGAFVDPSKIRQFTEDDFILPETPPFDWLIKRARHESGQNDDDVKSNSVESLRKSTSPVSPLGNGHQHNINNNNNTNTIVNSNNNNNNSTFKTNEQQQNDENKCCNGKSTTVTSPIKSLLVPTDECKSKRATATALQSSDDDNLLKELNFPFASSTSHVNDLAKFYRDCYHAPPLLGLGSCQTTTTATTDETTETTKETTATTSTGDPIDELSKQLEQFETSLEDYDKLVSQFGLNASSSTRNINGVQAN